MICRGISHESPMISQENTSDRWDIPWYSTREDWITIVYHAVENSGQHNINAIMRSTLLEGWMLLHLLNIQQLSWILIGCIFYGMVINKCITSSYHKYMYIKINLTQRIQLVPLLEQWQDFLTFFSLNLDSAKQYCYNTINVAPNMSKGDHVYWKSLHFRMNMELRLWPAPLFL